MEKRTVIHTAILDCDTPVPAISSTRGKYSDIFIALLNKVAPRAAAELRYTVYDSVLGHYPSAGDLKNTDTIIITGSAASAYDTDAWIATLHDFVKVVYRDHPRIKIFGSCFGHQIICHALFSPAGENVVCRDPAGWEVGVHPITLSEAFFEQYGPVSSNQGSRELRLQFVHADHVALSPSNLPRGFHSIGRSAHCTIQGVWKQGRVLTYQGHAEFDREVNRETLKVFGKLIWSEDSMKEALVKTENDSDDLFAAEIIVRFFLEEADSSELADIKIVSKEAIVKRACEPQVVTDGLEGAKSLGGFVYADGGETVAVYG